MMTQMNKLTTEIYDLAEDTGALVTYISSDTAHDNSAGIDRFVEAIKKDLYAKVKSWMDATDENMTTDPYWKGYEHGMVDALCEIANYGKDIDNEH